MAQFLQKMSLNALQEVPSVQLADARRILLQARQGVKDGKRG